jgi:hypothetical protein
MTPGELVNELRRLSCRADSEGARAAYAHAGSELEAALAQGGWLPIESAPRDGKDVLLSNGFWAFEATSNADGTFTRTKDRQQTAPGNCRFWQPLPAPPAALPAPAGGA